MLVNLGNACQISQLRIQKKKKKMYRLAQRVLTIKFSRHVAARSLQRKPGGVCTHNNSCIFTIAYQGAPRLESLTGNSYLHLQSRFAHAEIVRAGKQAIIKGKAKELNAEEYCAPKVSRNISAKY